MLLLTSVDYIHRARWEQIERSHGESVQISKDLAPWLTPETKLATLLGHDYMVYFGRPVVSLKVALSRTKRKSSAVEDIIDKYGVNTVFLPIRTQGETISEYLVNRYGAGQSTGSATLWRVRE